MLLLLVMCAVTSLILGLGLTTTACYIFLAILIGPALEKLGLNKMAVHMFIFYWGMLSSITPPVAIASFAAAGIAGAPAMKTGWESMWVGSIIYFIPFFFVANPALVLQPADGGGVPYFEALYLAERRSASPSSAAASRAIRPASATCAAQVFWSGRCESWWSAALVLATPGGGIMPLGNMAMELLALAILVPAILVGLLLVRRTRAA